MVCGGLSLKVIVGFIRLRQMSSGKTFMNLIQMRSCTQPIKRALIGTPKRTQILILLIGYPFHGPCLVDPGQHVLIVVYCRLLAMATQSYMKLLQLEIPLMRSMPSLYQILLELVSLYVFIL